MKVFGIVIACLLIIAVFIFMIKTIRDIIIIVKKKKGTYKPKQKKQKDIDYE